jgi:uncharacterized membrane protein
MDLIVRCAKLWAGGFVGFVVLDLVWIGGLASGLYRRQIGHVLNVVNGSLVVNIPAALATWAVIVAGIQIFVIPRASDTGVATAVMFGAVYGLVVYGTYDLTNYSLVKDWPLTITLVDMAWGMFACAVVSAGMYWLNRVLG